MAVARVTTIIGSSPKGWQDAVGEALKRANKTLRNLTGIRVLEQTAHIEKGKVKSDPVSLDTVWTTMTAAKEAGHEGQDAKANHDSWQ